MLLGIGQTIMQIIIRLIRPTGKNGESKEGNTERLNNVFTKIQVLKFSAITKGKKIFSEMGIAGLYKFLDPVVTPGKLSSYYGKVVAVDMPCWIHRGAIADAKNIVMSNGLKGTEG